LGAQHDQVSLAGLLEFTHEHVTAMIIEKRRMGEW